MRPVIKQIVRGPAAIFVSACLVTTPAAADYDFEAGLTYRNISGNSASRNSASRTDNDRIVLRGSWYYSGLSDTNGPASRSAFLDRASSVRLDYSYAENSVFQAVSTQVGPVTIRGESTPQVLDARFKHVWKTSGWYCLAGFTEGNQEVDFVASEGTFVTVVERDLSAYSVGAGKYLGQATALDLTVVRFDSAWSDVTTYVLSFSHVGPLGDKWHYAADLSVEAYERGYGSQPFLIGLSVFPATEFEFGINFHGDGWSILDFDRYGDFTTRLGGQDTWEGFISWFVREHVEVNASYRNADWRVDVADGTVLRDIDQFTIGVNVRF